ncbi:hypothetical protein AB1K32_09570 [Metabacillus dongyingensis]|uniref:hypothetical protein n=1 Tax=Metabacillus dongyingensis TaxID=2874282 RepID=UPI003B8D23C6
MDKKIIVQEVKLILIPAIMTIFTFLIGGFSLAYAVVTLDDHLIFRKIKKEQAGLFGAFGWIGHASLGICKRFLPEAWQIKLFRTGYLLISLVSFLCSFLIWQ